MSRSKYLFALGAVALGLAFLNFVIKEKERFPVRIVVLSNIIPTLPHWVAQDQGYYASEGLELKEYSFASSSEPVSALANGDADFLPGIAMLDVMNGIVKLGLHPILISHSRVTKAMPFESLIVPSGSSIENLKSLEGKTIAVNPGPSSISALKYFLKEKGVDVSKIEFKPLPPPQHLQALQSGDVACSHTYEPFLSFCLEGGKVRELYGSVYASLTEPCAIGGTLISYKLWAEKRPIAEKLIRVWDRSIQFIRAYPKKARDILKKRLNLTEIVAQRTAWVDATLSTELDKKIVEATIAIYKKMGLLEESFEFEMSYYYK